MTKRYIPKTKIVCTLGPASSSESVLRRMTRAGMDVARLNFSHGNRAGHQSKICAVREMNRRYRRGVRLLGDLEGPRIRFGYFPDHEPILLERKKKVVIVAEGEAGSRHLPIDYEGDFGDVGDAPFLYCDDGCIVLKIEKTSGKRIDARVVVGGLLKERKAVNIPGARLRFPRITEKDERDIEFMVEMGLDYVAQSFVRDAEDVRALRDRIDGRLPACRIIAKIENRDGIRNVDAIMEEADGIMIARGDMGVSIPIYEVPLVQKDIIRKCRRRKRLVITATQMLEHMVVNPRPTRAEVTDVANAVLDGTDCVMLSAETAVGKYPVETVNMMNQIIRHTEMHG
ncbi:MAG: pyruvate kinase [Lentisphaerae bacterium]|nr:pyruvate kinase [Lentisphaerota bacterium]